ncbi:hypothetical protein ACIBL6_16090 [Streptomyces sp. NPDC050400]|uniref:hypothetical protein n=1 Tax=Streptomyces sp. NPDC050400 TaxID=3365610 RepID=UPI00379F5C49
MRDAQTGPQQRGIGVRATPQEPVDYPVVREAARMAATLALGSTPRTALATYDEVLTRVVERMLREPAPARAQAVCRVTGRLVADETRPGATDTVVRLYEHVKNLGRIAEALADALDPVPARGVFVARPGLPFTRT